MCSTTKKNWVITETNINCSRLSKFCCNNNPQIILTSNNSYFLSLVNREVLLRVKSPCEMSSRGKEQLCRVSHGPELWQPGADTCHFVQNSLSRFVCMVLLNLKGSKICRPPMNPQEKAKMLVANSQFASTSNTQIYIVCSTIYRLSPEVGKPSIGPSDSPRKAEGHPGIRQPENIMRAIQDVIGNCFNNGGRKGRHGLTKESWEPVARTLSPSSK